MRYHAVNYVPKNTYNTTKSVNKHTSCLNAILLDGLTMPPQDNPAKIFITRQEKRSFKLLARVVHEIPKPLQTVSIMLCCPRAVEAKSVLLKTPCTLYTGPRGPELEPTWKLPPWGQVFVGQKSLGMRLEGETANSSQPSDFHARNELSFHNPSAAFLLFPQPFHQQQPGSVPRFILLLCGYTSQRLAYWNGKTVSTSSGSITIVIMTNMYVTCAKELY